MSGRGTGALAAAAEPSAARSPRRPKVTAVVTIFLNGHLGRPVVVKWISNDISTRRLVSFDEGGAPVTARGRNSGRTTTYRLFDVPTVQDGDEPTWRGH